MDKAKLLELADRVEMLDGPDREVDAEIWLACRASEHHKEVIEVGRKTHGEKEARFRIDRLSDGFNPTKSLDAAMTLVPEGWCKTVADYWCEGEDKPPFFAGCGDLPALKSDDPNAVIVEAYAATPALALTAAALRALAHA